MKNNLLIGFFLFLLFSLYGQDNSEFRVLKGRIALVIGNDDSLDSHDEEIGQSIRDAIAMERVLKEMDFQVMVVKDGTLSEMRKAVTEFSELLEVEQPDVGLFYYSGYSTMRKDTVTGIWQNYLVPTGVETYDTNTNVQAECLEVLWVAEQMESKKVPVNMMLFDTPEGRILEERNGLLPMHKEGFLIGASCAPYTVFSNDSLGFVGYEYDYEAPHNYYSSYTSLYTSVLVKHLPRRGLSLGDITASVSMEFRSYGEYLWWTNDIGLYYFSTPSVTRENRSDKDGDGLPDSCDSCPEVYSLRSDGCLPSESKVVVDNQEVLVKGGSFQMGCFAANPCGITSEKPEHKLHTVALDDFVMGKYEVTFDEYDAFCKATNRGLAEDMNWGRGKRPIINISWFDAVSYCNWKSMQDFLEPCYTIDYKFFRSTYLVEDIDVSCDFEKNGYRLPTEAEWEYAARGRGKEVLFGTGKDSASLKDINFRPHGIYTKPNWKEKLYAQPLVVGSFEPNSLGLYDMSGNVAEYCWDWLGDYEEVPQSNPRGADRGQKVVCRGGAWDADECLLMVFVRGYLRKNNKEDWVGFRLVRKAP